MTRIIGQASEFYRLRLTRLDEGGDVEFDWRDDILWRQEAPTPAEEADLWVLEAVTLDEHETVTAIASFATRDDAETGLEEATTDLEAMTRSEFESEYLREAVEVAEDVPEGVSRAASYGASS